MIHGELEDPGLEFFIQSKLSSTNQSDYRNIDSTTTTTANSSTVLGDRVLESLYHAKKITQNMINTTITDKSTTSSTTFSSTTTTGTGNSFDWTSSYSLALEMIPESHISARIAGKILFAGKAVKLLQSSGILWRNYTTTSTSTTAGSSSNGSDSTGATSAREGYSHNEAYRYLSSGGNHSFSSTEHTSTNSNSNNNNINDNIPTLPITDETNKNNQEKERNTSINNNNNDLSIVNQVEYTYQKYIESGGYTITDIDNYMKQFTIILNQPENSIENLEIVIEEISYTISNRLWVLLRDYYGFLSFLHIIRSTYLLGKGELFQSILDGIIIQTYKAIPIEIIEMNNILNYQILKNSSKLIGLDSSDDVLNSIITLKINSFSLFISNFRLYKHDILLIGVANEVPHMSNVYNSSTTKTNNNSSSSSYQSTKRLRVGQRTMVELCRPQGSSSQQLFNSIWSKFIRRCAEGRSTSGKGYSLQQQYEVEEEVECSDHNEENIRRNSTSSDSSSRSVRSKYCAGGVWLSDHKPISKGFQFSFSFVCAWSEIRAAVTASHPALQHSTSNTTTPIMEVFPSVKRGSFPPVDCKAHVLALGSVCCQIRGDNRRTILTPSHSSVGSGIIETALPTGQTAGSLTVGAAFFGKFLSFIYLYLTL